MNLKPVVMIAATKLKMSSTTAKTDDTLHTNSLTEETCLFLNINTVNSASMISQYTMPNIYSKIMRHSKL